MTWLAPSGPTHVISSSTHLEHLGQNKSHPSSHADSGGASIQLRARPLRVPSHEENAMKILPKLNRTAIAAALDNSSDGHGEFVRLCYLQQDPASGAGSMSSDPIELLKCAGRVIPIFVSATCLNDFPASEFRFGWRGQSEIAIQIRDADSIIGSINSTLVDEADEMCVALTQLAHFAVMPAARFTSQDWLQAVGLETLGWLSQALKIATCLQRARCGLTLADGQIEFPLINFQTVKVLPKSLKLKCRKVALNMDKQSGEVDAELPSGKHRLLDFKCADPEVFREVMSASSELTFVGHPVIDLLSRDELQLHSLELLSVK